MPCVENAQTRSRKDYGSSRFAEWIGSRIAIRAWPFCRLRFFVVQNASTAFDVLVFWAREKIPEVGGSMDQEALRRELETLQSRIRQLETELASLDEPVAITSPNWPPREFYAVYYAMAGAILGLAGAAVSLLFNVVGAVAVGKHPLALIQVYLTFPMGANALTMDSGLALAIGCCLYLFTGVVLGIPFSLVIYRWFANSSFATRAAVTTVLSLAIWMINFYGILSWLQPTLFGGRWIVDEIPWYVGAATHLVFGWTVLLLLPFARFQPPVARAEDS